MSLQTHATDPRTTAQTIKMSKGQFYILVEGETDYKLLRNLLPEQVVIRSMKKRDAVFEVRSRLEPHKATNFVCLVDADYDPVLKRCRTDQGLVYVSLEDQLGGSCIDLESAIMRTGALRKVCVEMAGAGVDDAGGPNALTERTRAAVRAAAAQLGAWRAALQMRYHEGRACSSLRGLESASELSKFVDSGSLTVDRRRLLGVMANLLSLRGEFEEVERTAQALLRGFGDGWLLCRGHDLTTLLAFHWSHLGKRTVPPAEVESKLRLAFEAAMLGETAFGRALLDASTAHAQRPRNAG
jgi:hypothetical protein